MYNKAKSNSYIPYRKLQLILLLDKVQDIILLNFIIKLILLKEPITNIIYNSILVIIDKLIKYAYFILLKNLI